MAFFRSYDGKRLRDRCALQMTRALFASRRYAECIEYSDSAFAAVPDTNLMKRMARRYVAGCWSRLGEKQYADSLFAIMGDMKSISANDPVEYMIKHNPSAPELMHCIRCQSDDTLFMRKMDPVAQRLLKTRKVTNRGDWYFLLAHISNEINHNTPLAGKQIHMAIRQPFSSDELKDLAYAYKIKIDAQSGDRSMLVHDLKWLEKKSEIHNVDAEEWNRICCNIIYADWVPRLWKKKDFATAILLCSYADNFMSGSKYFPRYGTTWGLPVLTIDEMRCSTEWDNHVDYGCLSFQMMGSLTSRQLAAVYGKIKGENTLYRFLRRKARTDKDYYYELIGSLALREEDYARAVRYLSRVSDRYQATLNVAKDGYLFMDAFAISYRTMAADGSCHVKLDFARKMLEYSGRMKYAGTADERGLARLMYAIGRRNSFDGSWALTQYWRGYTWRFYPEPEYWDDVFDCNNYAFLYDYDSSDGPEQTEALYRKEEAAALAMLTTDEARAEAQYILFNLATIVKRYVKTSCDNWRTWL